MKVLHVDTETYWGGGQQQALYLHEYLIGERVSSRFICLPKSQISYRLEQKCLPSKLMTYHGEWDFFAGWKLARYAKQHDYNILHLHSGHALSWGLWAKLFAPHIKLIATRRVSIPIKKNVLSGYKYKTKKLDHLVAISRAIEDMLVTDGISPSKISVINSGIDLDRYYKSSSRNVMKKQLGIPADALMIGTVANIVGTKDYPNLLQAAKLVTEQNDKTYFVAAGDGPLIDEMKELAKSLSLTNRFFFSGFVENIGSFLKELDIFVLSSKMEGLGTSVLDALSLKLPVIATAVGGIPEIVEDNINGILVPAQNPQALADAIINLIGSPSLRDRLITNARDSVKTFDYKTMAHKYMDLYEQLLSA